MNKITTLFTALSVATVLTLTSCGDHKVYPQNEGGGKAVKEIIEKNFAPEMQIEELTVQSADELYGELGEITIVYWEGDTQMEQVYSSDKGLKTAEESFASRNNKIHKPEKGKTLAIKEFDIESLPYKIGESAAFIPDEYENLSFRRYTFSVDNNGQPKQYFKINATKKGEGKSRNGRITTQNYYEFNFKIDENGKVIPVQ